MHTKSEKWYEINVFSSLFLFNRCIRGKKDHPTSEHNLDQLGTNL